MTYKRCSIHRSTPLGLLSVLGEEKGNFSINRVRSDAGPRSILPFDVDVRVSTRPLAGDVGVDRDGLITERVGVDVDEEVRKWKGLSNKVVRSDGREEGSVELDTVGFEDKDGACRGIVEGELVGGGAVLRSFLERVAEKLVRRAVDTDQARPPESMVPR